MKVAPDTLLQRYLCMLINKSFKCEHNNQKWDGGIF